MNMKSERGKGEVEFFFSKKEEFSHLKVRARGDLLTIESQDDIGNIYPHARLRRKSIHKWFLEMPVRRGWESTFIEGTIPELLECLRTQFGWTLAPLFCTTQC